MRIPPSFYNILGRFLLFIVIEAVCVTMIINDGIIQQYTIVEKLRSIQIVFWQMGSNIKAYSQLKSVNADLANQNSALMAENIKLKEQISTIKGRAISDSANLYLNADTSAFTFQWAKVIKNTLNTQHNYLIIDKGTADGISEDMGVITANGVVGIVRAAGKRHSFVLSFLNNKQYISAKLGKENTFGPLSWNGDNTQYATLNEIPQHIIVTQGDTVYTSGYSSFFPADIPLGITESSEIVNGIHRSVKVKLLQDFRLLNYVIVVKNNNKDEIEELSGIAERITGENNR